MAAYVYILASRRNGTLYTGVTSDLVKSIYQHKEKMFDGFTKKYNVIYLVYYEIHTDIVEVIAREKRIKRWQQRWKLELIEKLNPRWEDLYEQL